MLQFITSKDIRILHKKEKRKGKEKKKAVNYNYQNPLVSHFIGHHLMSVIKKNN